MKILRRYLARELLVNWLLVMVVLAVIFSLVLMIDEMERTNERYLFKDVLYYIFGTLPGRIVDMSPITVLLGTLLALGNMARQSELVVLRGAGISGPTLLRCVTFPILAVVVALALFEEFVAAPMHHEAELRRQIVRSGTLDLLEGGALWGHDGDRFIQVRSLELGQVPTGVAVYDFDDRGRLESVIRGQTVRIRDNRHWTLEGVQRKDFTPDGVHRSAADRLDIGAFWSKKELPVLASAAGVMAPHMLYRYIRYLDRNGQETSGLVLQFWRQVSVPLSAAAMILLAVPLGASLGSSRSGRAGIQLVLGALLGVGFYIFNQMYYTAFASLVTPYIPLTLAGLVPVILLLALAIPLIHFRR